MHKITKDNVYEILQEAYEVEMITDNQRDDLLGLFSDRVDEPENYVTDGFSIADFERIADGLGIMSLDHIDKEKQLEIFKNEFEIYLHEYHSEHYDEMLEDIINKHGKYITD